MASITATGGSTRPLLKEIIRKLADIDKITGDASDVRQDILEAIKEITNR